MFLEESLWLKEQLLSLPIGRNVTILDLGSSSSDYRKNQQPYIDKNVFAPLREKQARVIHLDKKQMPGVDRVLDFENLPLLNEKYDVVFCFNVLEHIVNREKFIKDMMTLVKSNGYIIITVPYDFEFHGDPIDTMYRPSNKDLARLFEDFEVEIICSKIIEAPSAVFHVKGLKKIYDILRNKIYHVSCLMLRKI